MTHRSPPDARLQKSSALGSPRDVETQGQGGRSFGPQRRVRKRADFQAIQGHGRRVPTRHFVLLLRARAPELQGGARLGITASKRIGNAVVRNRVKRIIREAFRHSEALFEPDVDLVVLVRSDASGLEPSDVLAEWREAGGRLRGATEAARRDQKKGPPREPQPSVRSRGRGR